MSTSSSRAVAPNPSLSRDALLTLATNAHQSGRVKAADRAYRVLLCDDPTSTVVLTNAALLLRQYGMVAAGIVLLKRVLRLSPDFIGALYSLGNALGGLRRHADAGAAFRRVVMVAPDHAYGLNNLGNVQRDSGETATAATLYRRACLAKPDLADAHVHLGLMRQQSGDRVAATAAYRRALVIDPAMVECLLNAGNVALESGNTAGALVLYRRAALIRPQAADTRGNLASALRDDGAFDPALAQYRVALALDPCNVNTFNNLGNTCNFQGLPEVAERHYRRALRVDPANPLAHFDLGITLLHLGRYAEGWPEYEWRWGNANGAPLQARGFRQPQWDGTPQPDRTLLLHVEQGFGDTIQFLRYLPMVRPLVGHVVLEVQPALMGVLGPLASGVTLVPRGAPLPPFDLHAPLLSLPGLFGTDLSNIPAAVPYLGVGAERREHWLKRLDTGRPGLRVGLVWAGSATFKADRWRSPRLDAMMPLLGVPGARFFGLQMGDGRRDLQGRRMPDSFTDLGPQIADFTDTAAIMCGLDLVISSCTGPAHLAAALGRPTWIIVPFAADWRWLTERTDSPWYPTVRLFRQPVPGEWSGIVGETCAALGRMAARQAA